LADHDSLPSERGHIRMIFIPRNVGTCSDKNNNNKLRRLCPSPDPYLDPPLSPRIKFVQLCLQSYRQQVLSVDAAYLHFTFSRAVSNLTILGVLLVRDIARQVESGRYLPREIACRGVWSKHAAALQSRSTLQKGKASMAIWSLRQTKNWPSVDQHHWPELTVVKAVYNQVKVSHMLLWWCNQPWFEYFRV
jgi:hypothetical protein